MISRCLHIHVDTGGEKSVTYSDNRKRRVDTAVRSDDAQLIKVVERAAGMPLFLLFFGAFVFAVLSQHRYPSVAEDIKTIRLEIQRLTGVVSRRDCRDAAAVDYRELRRVVRAFEVALRRA